ncbi:MAG: ATP-dependent DNA helicase RecG [Lachnospiraceae bacterium]|nr:ATP-dependent DNA helicase RecG [Lachnospiraceae bacterium]
MDVKSPVSELKGVGPKTAALFLNAGIRTAGDLLSWYPRTYEVFEKPVTVREARLRDRASIYAVLVQKPVTRYVKRLRITDALARDPEGGTVKLTWFNMPYLSGTLASGSAYVFSGKLDGTGLLRRMTQPRIFKKEDYEARERTLNPVYPTVKDLPAKTIQRAIREALEEGIVLPESLSEDLLRDYGLIPLQEAVREIHFPVTKERFQIARKRLVFEEFYRFILNLKELRENNLKDPNTHFIARHEDAARFVSQLPYELTGAQKKVLSEIEKDLSGDSVMNRLVQGDVGSGKTIVSFTAMLECALSGFQSVLMAPTEVLAKQHYENFLKLNEQYDLGLSVALLVGSMTEKEKKTCREKISAHQADIVVGTHALIQESVHYEDLGLVVTDEQHRFGVRQREALSEKGRAPHVLVMSATPIPRTLGMILYGDLDVSVMDEMPKNRIPIKNAVVDIEYREKAWAFIKKQVSLGHQAFVICPMVEESDSFGGEDVKSYTKYLKERFPDWIRVEYLHGKMKGGEKDAVMEAFAKNEIQVLVSTTVIEVGIDVPNATVMLVENAERFGLAQLHQLRGRVGRGKDQSYCIFVDTTQSEESRERLAVLKNSNDGFEIASEDLRLRGPGDFFGIRQSGDLPFRLGDIYTDAAVLKAAEEAAERTVKSKNPGLGKAVL